MKPKPKPKKAAVAKRPSRAPRKIKPRMREATHPKVTKKARPTMTSTDNPRGAGSGEAAVATRSRQPNETVPGAAPAKIIGAYQTGDIAKGRIDPEDPDRLIAHRDRRAYLLDQAQKNQDANDELNAIQVAQNQNAQDAFKKFVNPGDPDEMRDSSMETAVAALKMHDPDERKKQVEANQKARDKNSKASSPRAANQNSADFKSGQAAG